MSTTVKDVHSIVFDDMVTRANFNCLANIRWHGLTILGTHFVRTFQLASAVFDGYLANSIKSQPCEKPGEDMSRHTSGLIHGEKEYSILEKPSSLWQLQNRTYNVL